jgi:hypothetical protein
MSCIALSFSSIAGLQPPGKNDHKKTGSYEPVFLCTATQDTFGLVKDISNTHLNLPS